MTSDQVLAELEEIGVELHASGGDLWFQPAENVPHALLCELRALKPKLLQVLTLRRALALLPADFEAAGLRVVIYSELLGERIIFASDNAQLPESDRGSVVYRVAELRELVGLGPEDVVRVHRARRIFDAPL